MAKKRNYRATLKQLNLRLRHLNEQAEARVEGLNEQFRALHATGMLHNLVLLGSVILSRPYGVGGPFDSGQSIQAALSLRAGVGAIYWDTEDAATLADDPDGYEREASGRVVPFEECEPAVRALLYSCIPDLVERMIKEIDRAEGKHE
ncbi:hypothetical protein Pan216_07890 [Planctomycetes bacterium Pan216]|uniref:Uncharacterized protein n=1 Tax=Kolteria novifilia TaxID=2527975 RepID=A0A518AYZ4_9BACT|nr:hypothetical protein Pan216_07890 [Planctomycetes bacterium Pan216]